MKRFDDAVRMMPFKQPDDLQVGRLEKCRPFVRQSGDDRRPPWYIGDRRLFDYLLVYIAQGHGVFSLDDEFSPVKSGDLFWIPPDTVHSMRGTSRVMHCLYLHFDLYYEPSRSHWNAVIPAGLIDLSPWPERIHPPVDDPQFAAWRGLLSYTGNRMELEELMRRIHLEHRRGQGHSLCLSGMMLELLELLSHHTGNPSGDGYHQRTMDDAAVYIRTNAVKIPSVGAVAARFGFSDSHFRRLFQRRHGLAPSELLQQCRIKTACELLFYGSENISEVAVRCGFNSIYNFSRAFKRITGLSPRSYRR